MRDKVQIYTIPEKQTVEKCLTKLEEEIKRFSERNVGSEEHLIACRMFGGESEIGELCRRYRIDPLNIAAGHHGFQYGMNLTLDRQIREYLTDGEGTYLQRVVSFVNEFIPESYWVNPDDIGNLKINEYQELKKAVEIRQLLGKEGRSRLPVLSFF